MSDYAELRELLRLAGNAPVFEPGIAPSTCDEAADAIEALIAERDALREALELMSGPNPHHLVFHWVNRYLAGIDPLPQIDRMRALSAEKGE